MYEYKYFEYVSDLVKFLNDNKISKENIISITRPVVKSGFEKNFTLVYYR